MVDELCLDFVEKIGFGKKFVYKILLIFIMEVDVYIDGWFESGQTLLAGRTSPFLYPFNSHNDHDFPNPR